MYLVVRSILAYLAQMCVRRGRKKGEDRLEEGEELGGKTDEAQEGRRRRGGNTGTYPKGVRRRYQQQQALLTLPHLAGI